MQHVINTYDKGVSLALLNNLVHTVDIVDDQTNSEANKPPSMLNNVNNDEYHANPKFNHRSKIVIEPKSEKVVESEPIQISNHVNVPVHMANWEFSSSLTYVASVVTTIGYGHVTPITNEGKILTIVFGTVSIPCTLLFFSVLISMIRDGPIKLIEIWLIKLFQRFQQITLLKIRFLHLIFVTLLLFSLLILLPAFLFYHFETEWSFLDSFYYCFVTITTIGLGDYVPGQNGLMENRTLYLTGKPITDHITQNSMKNVSPPKVLFYTCTSVYA